MQHERRWWRGAVRQGACGREASAAGEGDGGEGEVDADGCEWKRAMQRTLAI